VRRGLEEELYIFPLPLSPFLPFYPPRQPFGILFLGALIGTNSDVTSCVSISFSGGYSIAL
jgi:hypothetical protein